MTSSDSGSYVVDMLSSGGNPNLPVWSRAFWASMEGAIGEERQRRRRQRQWLADEVAKEIDQQPR